MHKLILFIILIVYSLFAETFNLNFDFSNYNDTTIEFNYNSFDDLIDKVGFFKVEKWSDELHSYTINTIGHIEGFGPIFLMKSSAPSHPMYFSDTYSLVSCYENSSNICTYGKDPHYVGNLSYKEMLYKEEEFDYLGEYIYNTAYTSANFFDSIIDTTLKLQRYEIVPIVQDEINIGEGDNILYYNEYSTYLTNAKGQSLRLQLFFDVHLSGINGTGEYLTDTRLRISTDSSGNGKFKQKTDIFIQKPNEITKTIATVQGRKVLFHVNFLGEEVTITNCQGRKIKSQTLSSPSLLLEKIPAGIYFITIKGRNGLRQKVILK